MKPASVLVLVALLASPFSTSGETGPAQTGGKPTGISVKNLTCEQYAALPDDASPLQHRRVMAPRRECCRPHQSVRRAV